VEVMASHPSHLVLLDSYDPGGTPGWTGIPTDIQRANLLFRAVEVPAGRPGRVPVPAVTALAGASLSAAGLLAALMVTALSGRGRRLIDKGPSVASRHREEDSSCRR